MTLDDLVLIAGGVLEELSAELTLKAHEAMLVNDESQLAACLQIALRSTSIMRGMVAVMRIETTDSYDVLNRAAIEARDLLMYFRFDDSGTRKRIGYWFAGARDSSWKADHARVEKFLLDVGALDIGLARAWSGLSVIAHPTVYATNNSTAITLHRLTGAPIGLDLHIKKADDVVGVSRLAMAIVYNFPGWIALGVNDKDLPSLQEFWPYAETVAGPIVNRPSPKPLPEHSYTAPKKKDA